MAIWYQLTCSVKALDTSMMSHGEDFQMLASASSDGVVKTWTITKEDIKENGSYDTGNRLLCLALYNAAIEKLDSVIPSLQEDGSGLSSEDDSDEDDEEEEWNGIGDDHA